MIVDCVSDLHGNYPELEGGDLLIVAGDLTARDSPEEYFYFRDWLKSCNYKKKILVAGNHDNGIQDGDWYFSREWIGADYLCDSGTEFEGLKIWGSPWTLAFPGMNPHCKAFTVETEEELAEKWNLIPDDTDILVTHGPTFGIHDEVRIYDSQSHDIILENTGSRSLASWMARHVYTLRLHVYGHIHEGYGIYDIRSIQNRLGDPKTPIYVNASHVNEHYKPVNKPIRVVL